MNILVTALDIVWNTVSVHEVLRYWLHEFRVFLVSWFLELLLAAKILVAISLNN